MIKGYYEKKAYEYEEKRQGTIWNNENRAIKMLLAKERDIEGLILDIPCGTGRYFEMYESLNLSYIGIDISQDMIDIAQKRITADIGKCIEGNIWELNREDLPDLDVIVVSRYLHWLDSQQCNSLIDKLIGLSPKQIIFTDIISPISKKNPSKTHVHSFEEFNSYTSSLNITDIIILNRDIKDKLNVMVGAKL